MKIKKILLSAAAMLTITSSVSALTNVTAEQKAMRGNANSDQIVDIRDAAFIAKKVAQRKTNELPDCADHNMDGKKDIRDAADIARDVARRNIKTYNSAPIISGIKNGMTLDEVFDVVGSNYTHKEPRYANPSEIQYYYSLNSVEEFGINMNAEMFFVFSSKGKLYNFGYHIGRISYADYSGYSYPYSKDELLKAYNKIYNILQFRYGNGKKAPDKYYGILKMYSWDYTDYGNVMIAVGMDMWGTNSGINEITLSSSNDALRD